MTLALSWSGGKDSALALAALRAAGTPPQLLLTTIDEVTGTVPHHGVPLASVEAQAAAAGVPLVTVEIPPAAANVTYEARMRAAFDGPLREVESVAFGDLFLEDLRAYREDRLAQAGRQARFPLWGSDTAALARRFVAEGFRAVVVAVDEAQAPATLVGRELDDAFLDALPAGIDPCGERGEFHSFVWDGPIYDAAVPRPGPPFPPLA